MTRPQKPLFRLATYQSKNGPQAGIVIGAKIIDLGAIFEYLETKIGKKNVENAHYNSITEVLKRWQEINRFLIDAVERFYDNLIEYPDALNISDVSLLTPVQEPGKIINVGLNFYDHAEEMGITLPTEDFQPNFFWKGDHNCVVGPEQEIKLTSEFVDWEAELAVVIGKKATKVSPNNAMDFVAGYTCHNDVSDRNALMRQDGSLDFFSGKSRDTFAPLGPYLVPKEFIPDPRNLRIQCLLNDKIMQDFRTDQMIWGPAECVAFASSRVTLQPGDVISLGTGAGTGWAKGVTVGPGEMSKIIENMHQGGGIFLKPGDRIAVNIEPIGRLENRVVKS